MDQRLQMWKLLYGLVQRPDTEIQYIYQFVDEVLCREESLLRSGVPDDINNVQDIFIFWLIEKLLIISNMQFDKNGEAILQENKLTQYRLIKACFQNQDDLFERLILRFFIAVKQIHKAKYAMNSNELNIFEFASDAFVCNTDPMTEINENFSFQKISFKGARAANNNMKALIENILYALQLGKHYNYQIFQNEFELMCSVFMTENFDIKMLCLKYFTKYLSLCMAEKNVCILETQKQCISVLYKNLVTLWKFVAHNYVKLQQCLITNADYQTLQITTKDILKMISKKFLCTVNFEVANELQKCLMAFLTQIYRKDSWLEILKINFKIMFKLLLNDKSLILNAETLKELANWSKKKAIFARLIAINSARSQDNKIFELWECLFNVMNSTDEILLEFLINLHLILYELFHTETHKYMEWQEKEIEKHESNETASKFIDTNQYRKSSQSQLFEIFKKQKSAMKDQLKMYTIMFEQILSSTKLQTLFLSQSKVFLDKAKALNFLQMTGAELKHYAIISGLLLPVLGALKNEKYVFEAMQECLTYILSALKLMHIRYGKFKIEMFSFTICAISISRSVNLNIQHLIQEVFVQLLPTIVADNRLMGVFLQHVDQLWAIGVIRPGDICRHMFLPLLEKNDISKKQIIGRLLPIILCTADLSECDIFLEADFDDDLNYLESRTKIMCLRCKSSYNYKLNNSFVAKYRENTCMLPFIPHRADETLMADLFKLIEKTEFIYDELFTNVSYTCILAHMPGTVNFSEKLMQRLFKFKKIREINLSLLEHIFFFLYTNLSEGFVTYCALNMIVYISASLEKFEPEDPDSSTNQRYYFKQIYLLELSKFLTSFANTQLRTYIVNMLLIYLIHPNSQVQKNTIDSIQYICTKGQTTALGLWNLHKGDFMQTALTLALKNYLDFGIRLTHSLRSVVSLLGFSSMRELVCKYYRLIVAMLAPHFVKIPQSRGLISTIVKITGKQLQFLLNSSFLRAYCHANVNETLEVAHHCQALILKCTHSSIAKLMKQDLNLTLSEILIYFYRKPKFVMQAFKFYFGPFEEPLKCVQTNLAFTSFVADRFLGIITYFESCLEEDTIEKRVKADALHSLGKLLRAVGPAKVTHYRFKIIAMLSSVLLCDEEELFRICLKVWSIFLHVVDMAKMGSSLARIAAALLPMLQTEADIVNSLYEDMIVKNENVLGNFISELYFLQNMEHVQPHIKKCVERYAFILNNPSETVSNKLKFYYKQVLNENLQVRITAINHLCDFVSNERVKINLFVLQEMQTNYFMEDLINTLLICCWHKDRTLQIAASKCLGILGAIDPSYINNNKCVDRKTSNQTNKSLALSVQTDDFALMALQELCRAYQFQKNSKFVDNFALAIQETLAVFGISPKERKQLYLWEKLPEHVRQILTPLLNSSYTPVKRDFSTNAHPIFNSIDAVNYEDWAFLWAVRLIDIIKQDEIRFLLSCYKPSIKRDNTTLATFLPYMLLHALQDCDEEKQQQIYEEFMAIFEFVANLKQKSTIESAVVTKRSAIKEFNGNNIKRMMSLAAFNTKLCEDTEYMARTCCKFCAEQLDFLQRWCHSYQVRKMHCNGSHMVLKQIQNFIKCFDKLLLARASYMATEYKRALMYLEEYIDEDRDTRLQEQISFLLQIYGQLSDTDSVEGGLYIKKTKLNIEEQLLVYNYVDRTEDAMMCYEKLLSGKTELTAEKINGVINCFLRMTAPETAQLVTEGIQQRLTHKYAAGSKACRAEVLWRLVSFDELQCLMADPQIKHLLPYSWNLQLACALLLFCKRNNSDEFYAYVNNIRLFVLLHMHSWSADLNQGFVQSYDEFIKLHVLTEVEQAKALLTAWQETSLDAEEKHNLLLQLFTDWNERLKIVRPIVQVLEPLITFRRCLMQHLLSYNIPFGQNTETYKLLHFEIGKSWRNTAGLYREAGHLQQAQLCLMRAEDYDPDAYVIEKAKWLWLNGDQVNTFKLLEEYLQQFKDLKQLKKHEVPLFYEVKLLQANYNTVAMHIGSEQIIAQYKEAITAHKDGEKAYVHLADYLEKLYDAMDAHKQAKEDEGHKLLLEIMQCYAKSLRVGYEYVYESMPRLLSIWLDTTAKIMNRTTRKMNDLVAWCANNIHPALFYVGLSQMLSRLCHPQNDVFAVMRTILSNLLVHFPQQTLWMMLPFIKSHQPIRVKRAKSVLADSRLNIDQFRKLLSDLNKLVERLIELTNKDLPVQGVHLISDLAPQIHQLFKDANFSDILLPFERHMRPYFPAGTYKIIKQCSLLTNEKPSYTLASDPFPETPIYIKGIKNEISVLRSAAKPKKVCFVGSDGKEYFVMLKPKDDLRRDFRLMEFNGLVQRYLDQDVEARQRRLHIRTYAAIPFNEDCGLVEWIENLNSYRNICTTIYRNNGQGIADRELRRYALPKEESVERKRDHYLNVMKPKHPPVFYKWIREHFNTPVSWYEARSEYVRTLAVMSIVGYILGLGDRHGENVLVDEKRGDIVHVDFNCLFNHGENLAFPEVVPFRLTSNMVHAMGPLGIEGMFRQCCEITLRLLKRETRSLLSVLRPFVYDTAILDHQLRDKGRPSAEATDPKAVTNVRRIEERLQGFVQKSRLPLSVKGQVDYLITEATNTDNLAAMYLGWGAYL